MLPIEEIGLAALFALAFANGANDAGKSVASLMMPGPSGSGVQWDFLLYRVVLPLAGGPVAALVAVYFLDRLTRRTGEPGKERPRLMHAAHWGSGAATAFARGINDAPKMAALGAFFLLANPSEAAWIPYSIVAVAVFFGSLALGHRVVVTAIGKHAPLDQVQKSKAGAATALVVSAGAFLGAPMSTTQVHEGSSAGIGGRRKVIMSTLGRMLLPWLVTLPAAGILAIVVSYLEAMI